MKILVWVGRIDCVFEYEKEYNEENIIEEMSDVSHN